MLLKNANFWINVSLSKRTDVPEEIVERKKVQRALYVSQIVYKSTAKLLARHLIFFIDCTATLRAFPIFLLSRS